ncbi:sigma-70 family RNA polymerase sigma factor, partial [Streptomyces sp. SID3343]|uniref:sigma-70 family RNA polymerase sigma factor n=1 Tax=Streptomyces sp. SID3343 TaxID=2690260 RepID=UPI0013688695|nr:sigma-70 family RNA polymerase sigma factor [Streptomyces sp. SID3343]
MTDQPPEQVQAVDVDLVDLLRNDFVAFCQSHQLTLTRFAFDHLGALPEAEHIVDGVLLALFQGWDDVLRESSPPIKRALRMLTDALEERRLRSDLHGPDERWHAAPGGPVRDAPGDFVRFCRDHQQALTNHAWKHLDSAQDAEEAVADVLLVLSRGWNEIVRHASPPRALAYKILRRRIVDIRRRRGRAPEILTDFTAPGAPDIAAATTADPGVLVPQLDVLDRTIAAMPARRATCARLHLVMQLPLQDVADYLGVTISTVRSHVHAARKQLATALDHHPSHLDPTRRAVPDPLVVPVPDPDHLVAPT